MGRGRGDAALVWGEEPPGADERFAARALPEARFLDLGSSELRGVAPRAPEVDPSGEAAGLAEVEASPGKSAWRRRLAPRHRDAVRRFFTPE